MEKENKALQEELQGLRLKYEATLKQLEKQSGIEKAYAESQQRFKTIFEESTVGNKIIAADLTILQVNKALQQMLGYSEQELVGCKITDHAHPDFIAHWQELQHNLWTKQIPSFSMEVPLKKKNGSILWCGITSILFKDNETTLGFTTLEDITERKALVEQLSHSESMLAQSQSAAGVGSFIADLQTGMVQCSPVLTQIFGFPREEKYIHKDVFFNVFDANSLERHEQVLAKAIEQVGSYKSEYKIIVHGGEKWVWEKGEVQKDEEGKLKIVGVAQANDSETLQLLLGIINNSVNTVTVAKPVRDEKGTIVDLRYVLFNNTAKAYMGASVDSEHMIGKTLTELFPATGHNGNLERYIDTIENNKRYTGVEYFYPHEGMYHWFRESAYCFKEYIVITLEDITKAKNKEEELDRMDALLRVAFNIANIGGWQWKEDFSEAYFTPQLYQIYGIRQGTKIDLNISLKVYHPEDLARLMPQIQKAIQNKESYDAQYRIIRINDKQIRHVWAKGAFVNGKLTGIVQDITERVELELHNRKLAMRNDDLDSFVYTASHDLRSPVNNMGMLLEFLAKAIKGNTPDNEQVQIYITLLHKSITDLKNTLEDLTTITEIHAGEKQELVNLHTIVEEVQVSLFKQIEEAEAVVNVNLAVPFLTIPKKHARSLLYNLLSNALKFRSKDRKLTVKISSKVEEGRVYLSFQDNGMGIKETDQEKVFMIFKRFNPEIAGRGIGMYLVKRVIDLNEGTITLQSEENVGTTFHIGFPILK